MARLKNENFFRGGGSLFEIVIATSVVSLIVVVVASGFVQVVQISSRNNNAIKAAFLTEEGIEVMRVIRDRDWSEVSGIAHDSSYWLLKDGSYWKITATPQPYISGVFDRRIVVSNVYRDANSDVVSSPGTNDPLNKLVTVSVSYAGRTGTTTKSLSAILTDLF